MNFCISLFTPLFFLAQRNKGTENNPLIEELFAQSFRRLYQIRHQPALSLPGHDFAELFLQVRRRLVREKVPPLAPAPVVPDHHVPRPQLGVAVLVHAAPVPTGLGVVHVSEERKKGNKNVANGTEVTVKQAELVTRTRGGKKLCCWFDPIGLEKDEKKKVGR